jgi:hypothetical protein
MRVVCGVTCGIEHVAHKIPYSDLNCKKNVGVSLCCWIYRRSGRTPTRQQQMVPGQFILYHIFTIYFAVMICIATNGRRLMIRSSRCRTDVKVPNEAFRTLSIGLQSALSSNTRPRRKSYYSKCYAVSSIALWQ